MHGADAVVSMLGWSSAKPNGFSEKAVTAITAAAERGSVTRADAAGFLLDAVSSSAWSRRTAVLTTRK